MTEELAVWLYGDAVAIIERRQGRLRLTYTPKALDRFAPGTPLLSLSLGVRSESYTQGLVKPFIEGLLPEGESRRAIARNIGVAESDTYGLIGVLGRDCAGAMVIQPADESPPMTSSVNTSAPLTEDEIGALVRDLRIAPLGIGPRVKISLAGFQEKLALTRRLDGTWGSPIDGTPSTHILKPEIARFASTVENEAFCMRFARHLGLEVASVETTEIADRKFIVVERFDRHVSLDGTVERVHQEDCCQATGCLPEQKYQDDGGPSLLRVAAVLSSSADLDSLERLLRAVVLNVLIGNGDAHAKNFSLLHKATGQLSLAPLYDLLSTVLYGDDRLAMYVDNVRRTNKVTADRILNEALSWGMSRDRVVDIIVDLLNRVPLAMAKARDETKGVPLPLITLVQEQLGHLTVHE